MYLHWVCPDSCTRQLIDVYTCLFSWETSWSTFLRAERCAGWCSPLRNKFPGLNRGCCYCHLAIIKKATYLVLFIVIYCYLFTFFHVSELIEQGCISAKLMGDFLGRPVAGDWNTFLCDVLCRGDAGIEWVRLPAFLCDCGGLGVPRTARFEVLRISLMQQP